MSLYSGRVATEYSTGLYYLEIIKISFGWGSSNNIRLFVKFDIPAISWSRQASRTNFAQRSKMVTLVGPLTRPTCSGASAAVGPVNLTGTCRSTPCRGNGAGAALVPTNGTARPHQRQLVERGAKRCTVYHRKFTSCMNATPILEGDLETLLTVLSPRLGSSLRYM